MLVQCKPLPELPFETMGDAAEIIFDYIDRYAKCAKPHNALVDYERKRK